jgi:hypothetical protein
LPPDEVRHSPPTDVGCGFDLCVAGGMIRANKPLKSEANVDELRLKERSGCQMKIQGVAHMRSGPSSASVTAVADVLSCPEYHDKAVNTAGPLHIDSANLIHRKA